MNCKLFFKNCLIWQDTKLNYPIMAARKSDKELILWSGILKVLSSTTAVLLLENGMESYAYYAFSYHVHQVYRRVLLTLLFCLWIQTAHYPCNTCSLASNSLYFKRLIEQDSSSKLLYFKCIINLVTQILL